jgi:hypothetical protein
MRAYSTADIQHPCTCFRKRDFRAHKQPRRGATFRLGKGVEETPTWRQGCGRFFNAGAIS